MCRPPRRWCAPSGVVEVIPVVGAFDASRPRSPTRSRSPPASWCSRCTADGAADAGGLASAGAGGRAPIRTRTHFAWACAGLAPERAWRGRRCRSHERNLESLRFAHLIAPGALVVRREVMAAAAAGLAPELGADWWRALTRADRGDEPRRRRRGDRRPHGAASPASRRCPSFAPRLAGVDVLVLGQIEVSTSLYFDFLEAAPDVTVAFRAFTSLAIDAPHLAGAGLVVLVRTLHRFWDEGVIDFLTRPACRSSGSPTTTSWRCGPSMTPRPSHRAARMRRALGRRGGGLGLDRGAGGRPPAAAPGRQGLGPGAGPAAAGRRAAGRRAAHRRAAGRRLPRRRAWRASRPERLRGDGRGRAGPRWWLPTRRPRRWRPSWAASRDRGAARWSARSASSCGAGGATGRTSCCTRKAPPPTRRSSARPR